MEQKMPKSDQPFNCVILPKVQVQALQFKLHISYFLQKCKKGKPQKKDLTLLKKISEELLYLSCQIYNNTALQKLVKQELLLSSPFIVKHP